MSPARDSLLLCEQHGAVSVLGVYDIDNRRLTNLEVPFGHIRGGAAWGRRGITVPWSTPDLPHVLLEFDNGGTPRKAVSANITTEKSTVSLPSAEDPWKRSSMVGGIRGGLARSWF